MMCNPIQSVFDLSITLGVEHSENSPEVSNLAKHFEVFALFLLFISESLPSSKNSFFCGLTKELRKIRSQLRILYIDVSP